MNKSSKLNELVGRKVVEASIKQEEFLNLNFDKGRFHFQTVMAAWRIDYRDKTLVGIYDDEPRGFLQERVRQLNNKKLLHTKILNTALDTEFHFEGGYILRTFTCYLQENPQWSQYKNNKLYFSGDLSKID